MKNLFPILLLTVCLFVRGAGVEGQASPQNPSAGEGSAPLLPVDQENARKAKALLELAIQSLGGQAYLSVRDMALTGRGYSFFHGQPTSNGVLFWRFVQYPDKERVEVTKERDVAQVYNGDKGWEIASE